MRKFTVCGAVESSEVLAFIRVCAHIWSKLLSNTIKTCAKKKKPTCKQKLAAVTKALEEFYAELDARNRPTNIVMYEALTKIERALDMWWGKNA